MVRDERYRNLAQSSNGILQRDESETYRKENIMQGSPQMEASAIVPGPALVTKTSEAFIHSSMLLTKPCTFTLTFSPHAKPSSCCLASLLLPHTTTICDFDVLRPNSFPSCLEMSTSPPIPSPPPTTKTTGKSVSKQSVCRIRCLSSPPPLFSVAQNPFRMGKPYCTICEDCKPRFLAALLSASEGTKHLSTLRETAGIVKMQSRSVTLT